MVAEKFQIHGVKITGKYIYKSNKWIPKQRSPPGSYHYHSRQEEIIHFSQKTFFENLFSPADIEENYVAEKITKVLRGYWSQVLINPTIFVIFTF